MKKNSTSFSKGIRRGCVMLLATVIVCTFLQNLAAQVLPKALARFQFDGDAIDRSGNNGKLLAQGTPVIKDGALFHDGEYGIQGTPTEPECPIIDTPSLNFQAFTIAIRFKADSVETWDNIIAGGSNSRWFSMRIGEAGVLCITFDNQELEYELPLTIETDRWYSIVCGVDFDNMYFKTFVNGNRLLQQQLPAGLYQEMFAEKDLLPMKKWCLANYSNGHAFHGLIDELAVFDGEMAETVAADYDSDPALLELITGNVEQPTRFRVGKLKSELLSVGIEATFDGVTQFLDSHKLNQQSDQIIATLIQQLGDARYATRHAATIRLNNLNPRPLAALKRASRSTDPEVVYRARMLLSGSLADSDGPARSLSLALDYLKFFPNPNAVPDLLEILATCHDKRPSIELGIAIVSCVRPKNREQICSSLSHHNPWVRLAAVAAWARISNDKIDRQILEEYLSDPNELVQMTAISSLMINRPEERNAALLKLQSSPSFNTRFMAQSLLDAAR